jgi:hypothetical protein
MMVMVTEDSPSVATCTRRAGCSPSLGNELAILKAKFSAVEKPP